MVCVQLTNMEWSLEIWSKTINLPILMESSAKRIECVKLLNLITIVNLTLILSQAKHSTDTCYAIQGHIMYCYMYIHVHLHVIEYLGMHSCHQRRAKSL